MNQQSSYTKECISIFLEIMKVQRVRLPGGKKTWVVLDDGYMLIEPLNSYLNYLQLIERSPNTIRNYANHLKLYWEFLQGSGWEWRSVNLSQLADFIGWLRRPSPQVIAMQEFESARCERTINTIITAVCNFYDYHQRTGENLELNVYTLQVERGINYKPFLHQIAKTKPVRRKILKLKEPKRLLPILTREQLKDLIEACKHKRDKFLIYLLYETGMRIGQALGLRHSDIRTWDNEIDIIWRADNENDARSKSKNSYIIHVNKDLMSLYTEYIINEYPEGLDCDYVFVNCWGGNIGNPMQYHNTSELLKRLGKKVGIDLHAHLFRHTHGTDLIRQGWDISYVQKRLGHANIQTTINTYIHLNNDDLKSAYKQYLEVRKQENDNQ
ncbi:site-specific integrase [Aetokthonos hydrillicola Thurmond2011]|uniref:Site-specific integrase n=2 Tax=Aetokthonos TaxID=1550243 RepID=A0AAP5IHG3_9CYAN|nr:site-specific integrase [Aetokthonos hydrillicola Thurmond2011]